MKKQQTNKQKMSQQLMKKQQMKKTNERTTNEWVRSSKKWAKNHKWVIKQELNNNHQASKSQMIRDQIRKKSN